MTAEDAVKRLIALDWVASIKKACPITWSEKGGYKFTVDNPQLVFECMLSVDVKVTHGGKKSVPVSNPFIFAGIQASEDPVGEIKAQVASTFEIGYLR